MTDDIRPPPETAKATDNRPRILLFASAAGLVIGGILPWAMVRKGLLSASINGYEGDGIGTIAAGVVLLLLAAVYKGKSTGGAALTLILSAGALWLSVPKLSSVPEAGGTIGAGLVLTIIGGAVGLLAALMTFSKS